MSVGDWLASSEGPRRLGGHWHGLRHCTEAHPAPEPLEVLRLAMDAVADAPYRPDPMHAAMTEALNRAAAAFHPGGRFECPIAGCGWVLDVPVPELIDEPGNLSGPDVFSARWRYVGAPREQVELHLVLHLDAHAEASETGLDVAAVVDPFEHERVWDAP